MDKTDPSLADRFLTLLDAEFGEQVYQEFIEGNPRLIPREFVQNHGIHLDLVLRKLALGGDRKTDFFYLSKSSADWNAVLVEIEKPQSKYFKAKSNEFHADFRTALDQVVQWRAWFDAPGNFDGFINGAIRMLRVPPKLSSNPCHIKYVLVIGRRAEGLSNESRGALIRAQERHDFKILTYDSLTEALHTKTDLYVGVRKNEFVEIRSETFVSEDLFSWVPPEQLRINARLRASILASRAKWFHLTPRGEPLLDVKLPLVCDY